MPVLNTAQPWTEAQERQLAVIGLEATRAMEFLFEPMRQMNKLMELYFEPMRQMQKTVEAMTEPIRRMQETINNSSMIQMIAVVQEIAESQQKIIESLTLSPIFNFPKRTGLGLFPSEIIDGEIQDESNPKETTYMQQTYLIALPQQQANSSVIIPLAGEMTLVCAAVV